MMNKKKTEYTVFAPSKKARTPSYLNNNDVNIRESSSVRYLGIILDNKLNFKEEIKRILSRTACSIIILKDIRNCFPIKTRVTLLNALVLSHIQYSSLVLVGIRKNLMITLEKQFYWGIKVCFKRKKYDRSTDLKLKNRIMPVEFLLKYRCMVFFLKYVRKQLPAFSNNNVLQSSDCKQNARLVKKIYPAMKSISEFLDKSLMLQAIKLYNEFPYEQRQKLDKVKNIKGFLKEFQGISEGPKGIGIQRFVEGPFLSFHCFQFLYYRIYFLMFLEFQTL